MGRHRNGLESVRSQNVVRLLHLLFEVSRSWSLDVVWVQVNKMDGHGVAFTAPKQPKGVEVWHLKSSSGSRDVVVRAITFHLVLVKATVHVFELWGSVLTVSWLSKIVSLCLHVFQRELIDNLLGKVSQVNSVTQRFFLQAGKELEWFLADGVGVHWLELFDCLGDDLVNLEKQESVLS